MAVTPPVGGDAGAGGLLGTAMAAGPGAPGAGAQGVNAQMTMLTQGLEQVSAQIDALVGQFPPLAAAGQQAKMALKMAAVQALQAAPMQNMSGASIPGAGPVAG